ncbi:hypothetical protein QFC20_001758 [Naganishia adeliensis]|uniref:Uncharacterized protein n=1 Tax=Naganishia adeliensis TaxID=92952 RepID=A0ACC2WQN0_9TREE|nr:hypothetical protein QFC20_001758 [Naganishia adeliensis]
MVFKGEKGNTIMPPTASDFPGADTGVDAIEPRTQQDPVDATEKNLSQFDNSAMADDKDVVRYMGVTGDKLIWMVTVFATIGFSLFGYDQGLMSGIIASKNFNNEFPMTRMVDKNDVHHATIQGTVTAVYEVGAFFGALIAFFIGERLGRRWMMLIGGFIMIIGTVIGVTAFGPHWGFGQFIVSRVVTGVGNGMNTATIPSWVAECSRAHNRGFLVCIEASTVAVGTVIAYWVDFGLSFTKSSVSWRLPVALQIVFALFLMWGAFALCESPRWLLSHGKLDEGLKVVAALNGTSIHDPRAIQQRDLILDGIIAAQQTQGSAKELLKHGKKQNFRRMTVGASSQVFQQLGGCNAVIYYSTILFENQIGLETQLSLILGGVLAIIYAIFAVSSFVLVERCGRRPMFLVGTVGQAVAMFITFGCLLPGTKGPSKGAAFGLYLFIAFFGATWLPLPWLYPAELNSQAVRTQANAVSTMCNWLFNFLVVQVLPTMTASIGAYTFLLFALANCIFFPIIWVFYPETAGRELAEIDVIFAHAHLARRRPTLIADEMPALTGHQIAVLQDRYDIHGATDTESAGVTQDNVDLTLPPAEAKDNSETSTRVPSREGTINEKVARA